MLLAAGCGGEDSTAEAFCARVGEATFSQLVFSPYVDGMGTPEAWAEERLELVEGLEAPTAELEDDLAVWIDYLETTSELERGDDGLVGALTEEVLAASQALATYQQESCG
ncbi:hypothetical protein [Brachybacterium squillarum]|uniref:hypothetical protein n=1 Tax=Brachybacterium squillarum TaxID=661979 RepID=UPI0002629B76|nr:hypothetical protein [Brachybacterium squillarum]